MKQTLLAVSVVALAVFVSVNALADPKAPKHDGKGGKGGGVASTPRAKIERVSAAVAGIDVDGKTLKLVTYDGNQEHSVVVRDTTPITKNARSIKLSDIAEGDKLDVKIEEKDGSLYARSISVEGHGKVPMTKKHEGDAPPGPREKKN